MKGRLKRGTIVEPLPSGRDNALSAELFRNSHKIVPEHDL